jgi:hypothetical protein
VPGLPAGFTGVTDSTKTGSWAAGVNPAGTDFRVEISSDGTGAFGFVSASAQGTDLFTRQFTGLFANTTYYARVWSVSHGGDVSVSSLDVGFVVTSVRQPIMLNNFDTFPSSITVRWDGNGNDPTTRYRLEDLATGFVNDTVIGPSYTVPGLAVNSTHDFRVLAYNRAGNPTAFSNTVSTWTRAETPPVMAVFANSPIAIQLQLNTGGNPNGPLPASRTQYAIQAVDVTPDATNPSSRQKGLYLQPTGGDVALLNSATPVWATLDQWESQVDGDTVFLSSGLQPGQFYYWAVYARNGDNGVGPNIPTPAGPSLFTTTKSGQPVVILNGFTAAYSINNDVWVNTLDIPFQARGAFNTYYDLTQSLTATISGAFGADYYFNKQLFALPAGQGAHGWSGVYNPAAPAAPIAANGDAPLSNPPRDYASSLSTFHATGEGRWFLYVVGDAYAPSFGFPAHNTDVFDGIPFKVLVDVTAPSAPAMNLRAQRSATLTSQIVSGSTTGWTTPYFLWDNPDPVSSLTVSPIVGYSWSYSTDPSGASDPVMSTATPNFLLGANNRAVQMAAQPQGTFYFKVRSLDQAGNWSAPATFTFVCDPDLIPPTVTVTFQSSVFLPQGNVAVAVSTGGVVTLSFSEPMEAGTFGSINIRQWNDNMGGDLGGTNVLLNRSYTIDPLTGGATQVFLLPPGGFQSGYRYEITTSAGLFDMSGNPLDQQLSSRFVTLMNPGVPNRMRSEAVNASSQPVTQIDFLPNTWSGGYAGLAINEDPVNQPMASPAIGGLIAKADKVHDQNSHGYGKPLAVHEFNLYNAQALKMNGNFNQAAQITMRFNDADNNGYVDETQSGPNPMRVSALGIYWLDERTGVWSRLPSSVIDTAAHTVTARLYHFSVYGLLGAPEANLAKAHAYPVPYKPSVHKNGITFSNLSSVGTIKIFTVNGELVKTLSYQDSNSGSLTWNPVTNDAGDPLASDVYIYLIENDEQKKTGKLLVVR